MRAVPLTTLAVSAASGLVLDGSVLWIVADDGSDLVGFDAASFDRHAVLPLLDESWPVEPAARKRVKADLEALCQLREGVLLAVGSGSRPNRCRAIAIDVATGAREVRDLSALYGALAVPELNVEGALVCGDTLRLLQRGNGAAGVNALIDVELETLALRRVVEVELGTIDGVRWGFTDGTQLGDGRLLFSAAAEAGDDVYRDGACVDSAIGLLEPDGTVAWLRPLGLPGVKIEGIHVRGEQLYMVSDGDDPATPTTLYVAELC